MLGRVFVEPEKTNQQQMGLSGVDHASGDPLMDTPRTYKKRQALRSNERVITELSRFWFTCPHVILPSKKGKKLKPIKKKPQDSSDDSSPELSPETSPPASPREKEPIELISKATYYNIFLKIAKVLHGKDFNEEKCRKLVALDWESDSKRPTDGFLRKGYMTRQQFYDALFQVTDLWTTEISASHYSEFLRNLYNQITAMDKQRNRVDPPSPSNRKLTRKGSFSTGSRRSSITRRRSSICIGENEDGEDIYSLAKDNSNQDSLKRENETQKVKPWRTGTARRASHGWLKVQLDTEPIGKNGVGTDQSKRSSLLRGFKARRRSSIVSRSRSPYEDVNAGRKSLPPLNCDDDSGMTPRARLLYSCSSRDLDEFLEEMTISPEGSFTRRSPTSSRKASKKTSKSSIRVSKSPSVVNIRLPCSKEPNLPSVRSPRESSLPSARSPRAFERKKRAQWAVPTSPKRGGGAVSPVSSLRRNSSIRGKGIGIGNSMRRSSGFIHSSNSLQDVRNGNTLVSDAVTMQRRNLMVNRRQRSVSISFSNNTDNSKVAFINSPRPVNSSIPHSKTEVGGPPSISRNNLASSSSNIKIRFRRGSFGSSTMRRSVGNVGSLKAGMSKLGTINGRTRIRAANSMESVSSG